jgi:hypothetical protein
MTQPRLRYNKLRISMPHVFLTHHYEVSGDRLFQNRQLQCSVVILNTIIRNRQIVVLNNRTLIVLKKICIIAYHGEDNQMDEDYSREDGKRLRYGRGLHNGGKLK